jgi:hypothetical protein
MAEIQNNSESVSSLEQNSHLSEQRIERSFEQSTTPAEQNIPASEQIVDSSTYQEAQTHIKQVVEDQKVVHQQNPITKPLSSKLQEKYGWLLSIPAENRTEISVKLITTKGKDILEVIHAFLAIEDYVGLDRLEESLNEVYPTLIQEGILTNIHNK